MPSVRGVLTAAAVAETAASIAAMQEPDGAVPWTVGAHVDVWNHVEAAMALLVGGEVEAAERAYDWCRRTQRADGSWPMKVVAGEVEDASGETNMSAYLAVGVWHHWLVRRDEAFVERFWPVVRRALDFVEGMQLPFGGIAWAQEWHDGDRQRSTRDALLAGSSSIYQALRAGVALAELVGEPQPEWELAGGRLGHALREHRDLFLDKSHVLDGLVLPGPRWRRPRRRGAGADRHALGRLRGARARHPLRRHQPVGDRRRDLRAGAGARRARRPDTRGCGCSPTCSTCATTTVATGPATSTPTR